MLKFIPLFLFVSACTDFETVTSKLDFMSFKMAGGTVFSAPVSVSTKDIHFEISRLVGKEIILEGDIEDIGDYDTHVVISDEFGRILVVLTELKSNDDLLHDSSVGRLKIWGVVERGKKGLPFVQAKAIRTTSTTNHLM